MGVLRLNLPWRIVLAALLCVARGAAAQSADAFNANISAPGVIGASVLAVALQPDGKVIIGGNFTVVGGVTRMFLARLQADGTLDTTFNPGADDVVHAIVVQGDGKLLIAGQFTTLAGATRNYIGRLNADGTIDAGFNPGADFWVTTLALQSDGAVLVSGPFTKLGGGTGTTTRNGIGRLTSAGGLDAFNPGTSGQIHAIAVQANGQVVVGGSFTQVGGGSGTGSSRANIARFSSTGVVDATFDPGVNSPVLALAIEPDGQILVGGDFTLIGGGGTGSTSRSRLARLNAAGTVDAFDPGANDDVQALALQADGRVLVGGLFAMLGGGGAGTTPRNRIGRVNADGSLDTAFNPNANGAVNGLAMQGDGKVLVAGAFTTVGSAPAVARNWLARLTNAPPTQSLTVTGGNVITWLRGGGLPELTRAEFWTSGDGMSFFNIGAGTRVAGGWQLAGPPLGGGQNLRIRARGFTASGYKTASGGIVDTLSPISGVNLIENNGFSSGTTSWTLFALPTAGDIVSNITGGVFQFYRSGTQAVVFQQTGMPLPAQAPLEATFQMGNSDTTRKRVSVLIHDADFSDLHVCTFWLPAGAPLASYTIRTHTTEAWTDATLSFYAATAGSAGGIGYYRLDNVTLAYLPANSSTETLCDDPLAPTPPGGINGPDLITNGSFVGNTLAPWFPFGNITSTIFGEVFQFYKQTSAAPAGSLLQTTNTTAAQHAILEATFQLGNSSAVRKRVTVLVHDSSFGDLSACTFWIPPGQVLSPYVVRTYATAAWANATLSFYPATVDAQPWILLDNVTLRERPGAATAGTNCFEPGSAPGDPE